MAENRSLPARARAISGESALRKSYHWTARYRGAVELGWYDFVTVYRRSFFGPVWPMIQMALWIGSITLVFHEALGDGLGSYALYVGLGLYAWDFIQAAVQEGPSHFTSQGGLIKNVPTELSIITVRKLAYLFFRAASQIPVPIFLVAFFGGTDWHVLLILPVTVLFLLNAFSALTIGGILGVYFRDLEFFIPTVLRFLFFVTPIFWSGDAGFRKLLADYNPFSYFLELFRAPLNGESGSLMAWGVVAALTVVAFLAAIVMQRFHRSQIAYRV